ncbi:MAG: hypothetical protein ACYTAF_08940 [Planctomycetota bacterium]|jgi:hypothetical protein
MGELFRRFGFDIGGHWNRVNGMAHDFPPAVQANLWPLTEARKYYKYIIQVVRNPVKVVESSYLWRAFSLAKQTAEKIPLDGKNNLENTIQSVVLWNRAIEATAPDLVVKVEHPITACMQWFGENEIEFSWISSPPGIVNARNPDEWDHGPVPWASVGKGVMKMLDEHREKYGYPK